MQNISSILLLGTENILALSVIRALGSVFPDARIHTFSPCRDKKSIPERSRYVHTRNCFNSWDENNLPHKLVDLIGETQADIVLPVSDASVRFLASIKEGLQGQVRMPPLPSLELYRQLEEKDRLAKLLTEHDFAQAETWYLGDTDPAELPEHLFPLLLKPVGGSSGVGIQMVSDRASLMEILSRENREEYILQEHVSGKEIGCSVLAVDGELKAYTIQEILGEKGFGVASALKFIDHPSIYDTTCRLLSLTGYSGLAHLDYKLDERDGKPKLIDFNARFWASLLGSRAAGVDFTRLCCMVATGVEFERPEYRKITYFLGRNTLRYYMKKLLHPLRTNGRSWSVHTDLWDRLGDPMPEFARYMPT